MRRHILTLVLCFISSLCTYAQEPEKIKVDSMRKEAKAMPHGEESQRHSISITADARWHKRRIPDARRG